MKPETETPADYIGQPCSFDYEGKKLVGMIEHCEPAQPFGKGQIRDFKVLVRGASGKTLSVSMVRSYMRLTNLEKPQ